MIVIEHPSGTLATEFELEGTADNPVIRRAAFVRTARKIMAGDVYVPGSVWSGREADAAGEGGVAGAILASSIVGVARRVSRADRRLIRAEVRSRASRIGASPGQAR